MHRAAGLGYKPDGTLFRYPIEKCKRREGRCPALRAIAIHGPRRRKPAGLTIAWINRRQIALDGAVPRPDFILPDIQFLSRVVHI